MTTSELIAQHKKILRSQYDPKEDGLSMLLEKYAEKIALHEPDGGWTSDNAKLFREVFMQKDVTGDWHVDIVIYRYLRDTKLFWAGIKV